MYHTQQYTMHGTASHQCTMRQLQCTCETDRFNFAAGTHEISCNNLRSTCSTIRVSDCTKVEMLPLHSIARN